MFRYFGVLSFLLLSPVFLSAQAAPAVRGGGQSIWAGGEYSNYSPDFGPANRLTGIGIFGDLNWSSRWGVEAQARLLRFNGFSGESESNYLAGPEVTLLRRGKFRPYAKILLGAGNIKFPYKIGSGSYFAYAPGGGLDYRLTRRFVLRGEYEHQFWPSAPGIPGEPSHGMQPSGFSFGFAYRLFCSHCG